MDSHLDRHTLDYFNMKTHDLLLLIAWLLKFPSSSQ